jgi:hypothetical protein
MQIPPKILDRPQVVPGKNENGFVLIVAMLMLLVITLMGISMSNTSTMEVMISGNERRSQEQFYIADAGVNAVIADDTDPGAAAVVPTPLAFTCAVPGVGAAPFESYNIDGIVGDDVDAYLLFRSAAFPPRIEVATCPAVDSMRITAGIQLGTPNGAPPGTGDRFEYTN